MSTSGKIISPEAFKLSHRLAKSHPTPVLLGIFLGRSMGCKNAIIYTAEPLTGIDQLLALFNVILLDAKSGNELRIEPEILEEAMFVSEIAAIGESGFPAPLAQLARNARVSVIASRPNLESAEIGENCLSHWLKSAGLRPTFTGSIYGGDSRNAQAIVVIDNLSKHRQSAVFPHSPTSFSVTAIMAVYNESDLIVRSLEKLLAQGVDVYLIDNWSTDGTYEAVMEVLGPKLIGSERFPATGPTNSFDLRSLLTRKQEIAKTLKADWFIHCDADEIRYSPWPDISLRDAIYRVDQEGYNAINHTIMEFHPTDNNFISGLDFEEHFQYFSFGAQEADFVRINAWKNIGRTISLATTGGHQILFEDRRIYPYKFLAKHYPIRSQDHGVKKIFRERRERYLPAARARGWHIHYDHIQENHSFLFEPTGLTRFDSQRFHGDYLVERLTGIGSLLEKPSSK